MKKIPVITFILLSAVSHFSIAQKDSKADGILKSVSAKYKSFKSLTVAFNLTIENQKEKTKDKQTGNITIKGDKYKLDMNGQEVISDGKSIWTFLKEENEVQINDAAAKKEDAISPTTIFTIYEKGFRSKYIGEKKEGAKVIQQVELVPEDAKKPYFKIQLSINKTTKFIESAKILNKSGSHIFYIVEKFNADVPAPDNLFSFDTTKHPGVEVVDLR
ncbi:MAG: outer membrane lipoprotein carrier protein LolA [Bacteroidia bacterium]